MSKGVGQTQQPVLQAGVGLRRQGHWKAETASFFFFFGSKVPDVPGQYILATAVTYWEVLQHHLFEPAELREKGMSSEKGPASKLSGLIC